MIGKARAISHTGNALKYALTKKDAVSISSNLLSSADDSNRITLEMKRVQELNTRCKNNCIRIEVSPAREDSLMWGEKQWENLTELVADRVGLNNRQYVSVLHKDTDIPHLHIVANRVDFEGEALNDSFISYKLGLITEKISRDNGLTVASEIQQKKKYDDEYEKKVRKEIRKELKKEMKAIMDAKPKNGGEFSKLLKQYDIEPLWKINKKGTYYGVNFKKDDNIFKGSDIGKPYGINKLKASFELNKQDLNQSNNRGMKI